LVIGNAIQFFWLVVFEGSKEFFDLDEFSDYNSSNNMRSTVTYFTV